jgi:hypothetical protein
MRGDSFVGDNEWKCLELMCVVDSCLCEDPYDKNTIFFFNSCNISEIYNTFLNIYIKGTNP